MRQPIIPQLDVDQFIAWERGVSEKFELHHGFIVAFAGATGIHNMIAGNLYVALRRAYPAPCKAFGSDMKLRLDETTAYYPDAAATCEPVSDDAVFIERPEVVVEILSRSTKAYDIVDKRAAYRRLDGLRAYVIVHTDMRRVEVDSPHPGGWRTTTHDDGSFLLGRVEMPLDDVYEGTDLATE